MHTNFPELHYSLDTMDQAVKQFWTHLHTYRIFAFSGEMGAGKTTFIHKLCDHLQVQDTVSSPTFALINEYHFTDGAQDMVINHMDWYRLKNTEEAISAGMEDCIDQARRGDVFCFIEWPEKARALLSPPYLWISIENVNIGERKMTIQLVES